IAMKLFACIRGDSIPLAALSIAVPEQQPVAFRYFRFFSTTKGVILMAGDGCFRICGQDRFVPH
ncbi:MAG: hypothetical protein K1563_13490, partial [Candidatus Thiodiazotropha sp. (ex. Lucinisca nassula)]|nr:hypothetical protein [Candidatus Thiodiazotropha sp. (ex. Lucinisca nassula)]MBW9274692.1 hypothetical protein [Candidatus Thiodiazotropha sp. (ex. Lucinisca nassula)]